MQLLTSGVFPEWNDLSVDTGVLLLDRIVRNSLVRSLPERTMDTQKEMVIPVSTRHQHADHKLTWPINSSQGSEAVAVEVLGAQKYGVVIRGATDRGFIASLERKRMLGAKCLSCYSALMVTGKRAICAAADERTGSDRFR